MCLKAPCRPLGWQNQPKPICWPKLTNLNETQTNVMNTISMPVPVCLLERNISISAYFGYRFGIYRFIKKKKKYIYIYMCGPILPCVPAVWGERPGPIFRVRGDEHPRTSSRGMDKITIRGEVEHVCKELGRVRGRWSPRYFCPRCLVNLLITQNNA